MRPIICLFFSLFLFYNETFSQTSYPIIPYPNKLVEAEGEFEFKGKLSSNFDIAFKSEMKTVGKIFEEEYFTRLVPSKNGNLVVRQNSFLGKEAYKLTVTKNKILVEASTGTGCFYAFQTIRQLMKLNWSGNYSIPTCIIEDQPSFSWRAYMLDEARNFQGKEVVKDLIDQMALLKMNVFHWHLTDNEGWRIEIKKYPLLTGVGALNWFNNPDTISASSRNYTPYRPNVPFYYPADSVMGGYYTPEDLNSFSTPKRSSLARGGYYTQADIKEIVDYASKRQVTIIPEIDIPGHSLAAIKAYPWLFSSSENRLMVANRNGARPIWHNVLNVANVKVIEFYENVLKEVMLLFPGKIIHIGGDEVRYNSWEDNSDIKQLMQSESLKSYADVQLYFSNRISRFIKKNGFRTMGWNEIIGNVHLSENEIIGNVHLSENENNATGELNSNTIVHFWKGDSLLFIDALNKGYDVVNSSNNYTYLDWPANRTSISKAYHFSPIPKGISNEQASHILGLGCQMWGEVTPRVIDVYQYTFPRIAAYAEVGWTKDKDFERFCKALSNLKLYWDRKGIYYLEE